MDANASASTDDRHRPLLPEPPPVQALTRLAAYPWLVVCVACLGACAGQVHASIVQLGLRAGRPRGTGRRAAEPDAGIRHRHRRGQRLRASGLAAAPPACTNAPLAPMSRRCSTRPATSCCSWQPTP
jgi:hypothetical protein